MAEQEVIKDTQDSKNKLPPLENIYFLYVKVTEAKDLEKADFTGSSDPFCKVSAKKQSWSTKTIEKNTSPQWNEETSFVFFEKVEEITFEVFDWDKGSKHDSIGKATLNTSEFYKPGSKGFVGWVKLKDCKKGEINISVTGKTIKPLEMEKRCDRLEAECKEQQGTIAQKKQQIDAMIAENGKLAEKKAGHIQSKQRYQSQLNELKNKISAQIEENSKKKRGGSKVGDREKYFKEKGR